ncbi:uncharacterized protein LOC128211197 isoform X2 [Mya arenaria]|uniref:uncharacterized protein LOC128211197 isoform X2 n=1 Tax=Mya arenaria TaxID=6604 RepID=UPI0022DF52C1|nr:uncharacterized protein LOC128211197 isoform X2 [Mya arenaria]
METYLTLLYVTIEQEVALKELFLSKGWLYAKPDLSVLTSNVGPPESFTSTGGIVKFTDDNGATEQRAKFVHPKVVENEDGIVEDTCVKVEYDDEYGGDTDEVLTGQDYDDDDYNADDHDDDDDFADLVEAAEPVNEAPKETRKSPRNRSKKTKAKSVLTNQKTAQVISFQADGSLAQTVKETPKSKKRKVDGAEVGEGEAVDREDMMPRKVIRGSYRRYDIDNLNQAYMAVMEKRMSISKAALAYDIPKTTLLDRLGKVRTGVVKSGTMPLFSQEQEAFLSEHIQSMAEIGYGYNRMETIHLASDYAISLGLRRRERPLTDRWLYKFLRRWPELYVGNSRSLEAAKANGASRESIDNYFDKLNNIMVKYDIAAKPHLIYNVYETALETKPHPTEIVSGNHNKTQASTSGRLNTVTLIGCVNGVGQQIPPYFVFPGAGMLEDLMKGASPGAAGTVSITGCLNKDVFESYIKHHLLKYLPPRSPNEPVLILYDGHKRDVSLSLIGWAKEDNMILFVTPPRCGHLQPLDVSCFGPMEEAWKALMHSFMNKSGGISMCRDGVAHLACEIYRSTLTPSNIMSAFKESGIYPLNRSVVPDHHIAPSTSFIRDSYADVKVPMLPNTYACETPSAE